MSESEIMSIVISIFSFLSLRKAVDLYPSAGFFKQRVSERYIFHRR